MDQSCVYICAAPTKNPYESDQSELSLTLLRTPIVRGGGKDSEVPAKETRCERGAGRARVQWDVSKVTVEEGMEDGEEVVKDPLKWFGELLSKCLPQAQQNFM